MINFEDVEIGMELPKLIKGPVTQTDLVRYSGASGDFNPIHTVPEIARSVGLEGAIAHGMLIMAYAGQVLTNWADPTAIQQLKVRFTDMTKPGEILVCSAKITKKNDDDKTVSGRVYVVSQADESQKLKGTFTLKLPLKSN